MYMSSVRRYHPLSSLIKSYLTLFFFIGKEVTFQSNLLIINNNKIRSSITLRQNDQSRLSVSVKLDVCAGSTNLEQIKILKIMLMGSLCPPAILVVHIKAFVGSQETIK